MNVCLVVHSNTVAPVCANDREELLGALKHETLHLKCEVDSSPPAEAFHWTFNSSGEQTELTSQLQTSSETGWSRLNYTPTSDLDYGTISCWAKNAIGSQKTPCVFQIVAAGESHTIAQAEQLLNSILSPHSTLVNRTAVCIAKLFGVKSIDRNDSC